jgi:hypothetical protein
MIAAAFLHSLRLIAALSRATRQKVLKVGVYRQAHPA